MNIRIGNNSIRFRINNLELAKLLDDEVLREKINLPDIGSLEYSIHKVDRSIDLFLIAQSNRWKLEVSSDALANLQGKLPCKDGIVHEQILNPGSDKGTLKVVFDVDVQT